MDVSSFDHVNLRIPADGLAAARSFYGGALARPLEGVAAFEADEKPFFDVRLTPGSVIHLWPTDAFEPPSGDGFNHLALLVDHPIDEIERRLAAAAIEIDRRADGPRGATGTGPALYVTDPFGYQVELKAAPETG